MKAVVAEPPVASTATTKCQNEEEEEKKRNLNPEELKTLRAELRARQKASMVDLYH